MLTVLQEIGKKNIFNFLSDEGLLPNYAFPEAGIILRAVLYRKEDEETPAQKKKYEKMVYEYSRSASSAISEFAPNNSFYVDGRKLTIDQVDLTTAQTARWRLCPNCSHAQIEETGKNTSACPQCGSPAWADAGQVRTMLKVQMVYSNMDYTKSLINDESDDRNNVFYCKQLLVDVDEDHDISSAYRMDNEDFPFGYEFVRKATLREINFGESDMTGEKLSVSGVEEVRKGFRICKYCGKIQPENGKANHSFACKTRKMPTLMQADAYEECLFLYREFSTEILRLLVPATTMDSSSVKMESFVAAFMLGMKEYFGNVDHLRATVSEVPVPDTDYRKQYLVIYDSVPGGTGYVKATRNGRGTRLDRKKKMQVWKVFENYQNLMKENQIRDINTAMYESTKLLQSAGRKPRYASIIIDEGQDFSDNAYRLIRALAGEEHPNDIFIVGDSHQRIYRNHPTLSKCGINVRGRSSILKINYRTTEEIRKHAFALLNGISFDDLDEDLDLGDKCQSLTHGEKPIVENFGNANDEFDFLLREVKKLKENGVSLTDICVVARTKKLVDDYIALFTRAGIRSYAIKRNKVDDRSFDGLRVATMHRVKGLEFKYVFIAAVNNRIIPLPSAINKTDAVSEAESITSEKCLLYVAMTRAQKGVYITSYGRPSEFLG